MSEPGPAEHPEPREWLRLIGSADDDPLEVLRVVGTYQRYLAAIEDRAVATAKGLGRSWEEIAKALGVKRQSAWARFGPKVTTEIGTIRNLLPLPRDPTAIGLACPKCGSMKVLSVQWRDEVALVRDEDAEGEDVALPGEVPWTCPTCKRQHRSRLEPPPRPT